MQQGQLSHHTAASPHGFTHYLYQPGDYWLLLLPTSSIVSSSYAELLKRMLIDTRDPALLWRNIGMFSDRMAVSLLTCPVAPAPDHGSLSESLLWAWH